ncbi:hypothetical protein KC351_g8170 [Hortaea werneckii]|nr:hypothetical protein KC351_g8170 [Hortaea werneckii]
MPKYIPAWKRLGMTLRYKSADAPKDDQVFRFLDLPAEMRNLVYRELLVWPSNKPERCWPQILSTCRQVNDEAKRIIYTENAAKVKRLEDSLDANEHAINIVTQAAYDEVDRPIRHCRDIYLDGFISLTDRILDHEEEKFMIDIIERLELWVKTTIQALERDAEVAKARIDAVMRKVRKVAELPES